MTKFALLAKKRAFWAVLRVWGEFCPDLATSKLSRESFVPAARLEADAELVERSGEMLGVIAAPVGGRRPGVNTHADR